MDINPPCSGQTSKDSVGNSYIIVPAKFFEDLCHILGFLKSEESKIPSITIAEDMQVTTTFDLEQAFLRL